jgi:hypothetical protein
MDIAWIPTKFAKVGKIVDIKLDDVWDKGWKVEVVWETVPEDRVVPRQNDYQHQHEASDAYRDRDGRWVTPQSPKG